MNADQSRDTDPLKGLETLVGVAVVFVAVVSALLVVSLVAGTGSLPGVRGEVCATTDAAMLRLESADPDVVAGPGAVRDGVAWRVDEAQLCDDDPDGAMRALAASGLAIWAGGPLLGLALLWRFLRRARRDGVFADAVPGGLRVLGRLVLAWAALDLVLSGWINAALVARMTSGAPFSVQADVPWVPLLLGVALLALAKVMEQAVEMRHDVEATI